MSGPPYPRGAVYRCAVNMKPDSSHELRQLFGPTCRRSPPSPEALSAAAYEREPQWPLGDQSFNESVMEGSGSPLSGEVVTPVPMARNSVACSPQMWL
jgi:hypothetical protein